jgi:hypothetical protein
MLAGLCGIIGAVVASLLADLPFRLRLLDSAASYPGKDKVELQKVRIVHGVFSMPVTPSMLSNGGWNERMFFGM